MSENLSVEQLLLCEYATQDFQGKFVLAGLSSGTLVFEAPTPTWPPFKIFVEIKPLKKNITATIRLSKEGGKTVVRGLYKYSNPNKDKPSPLERNFLNIQVPPVPFEGPGLYVLEVADGDRIALKKEIFLSIGVPASATVGTVNLEMIDPPDRAS